LQQVVALAEKGKYNTGLENEGRAKATLRGGSFTGRGGSISRGISNHNNVMLDAESVTALGENGGTNFGLQNSNEATATLRGGSFTGRGGSWTRGISNYGNIILDAESVTALGENGSITNTGLRNQIGATVTLSGGSFSGRGGADTYGIRNDGSTLETESVTALGENGSLTNSGLYHYSLMVTLRGGSFTGRGGTIAWGIHLESSYSTLEAESITALGENGSSDSYGLRNDTGATATANSSQFIGSSNGLYQQSGTVHLGVSQLEGGATRTGGTLICFQVYDSNYTAYTCP
jgi:hypothetical protein